MWPSWRDFQKVLKLKTFYIALSFLLISVVLLVLWANMGDSTTIPAQVLLSFAIALLTAAVISLAAEVFLRLDTVDLVTGRVEDILSRRDSYTMVRFGRTRRQLNYVEIANEARGTLRVVAFSGSDILASQPLDAVKNRIIAGDLSFRVLLIDPQSEVAGIRARAVAYPNTDAMGAKTNASLHRLADVRSEIGLGSMDGHRFEVRLFCCMPTISAIIDDNQAYVTPVVENRTGGRSPFFVCASQGLESSLFNAYLEHFEAVWLDSEPVVWER